MRRGYQENTIQIQKPTKVTASHNSVLPVGFFNSTTVIISKEYPTNPLKIKTRQGYQGPNLCVTFNNTDDLKILCHGSVYLPILLFLKIEHSISYSCFEIVRYLLDNLVLYRRSFATKEFKLAI